MKIIIKHSTVAKVARITKNMDSLMDSLLGTNRVSSEHYADPVKGFNQVRKNKVLSTLGKAAQFTNDPKAKEMTIEVNPNLIEDVLGAAEVFTTTVYTVAVPAVKVYHSRLESIQRKYKLK